MVEPGSTFKIVVVSAALNEGLVTLTDTFDCENGQFYYYKTLLRDHERYGVLTVENIITKSSNIGAAKIGLKLGEDRLYDTFAVSALAKGPKSTLGVKRTALFIGLKSGTS